MNKVREHELLTELRAARIDHAAAVEAEDEARRVMAEKKTIRRKVEVLVEEILDEITTGKRRDPLIELMESNGDGEADTADERQRGPTAASPPPPAAKPKRERADARTADHPNHQGYGDWSGTSLKSILHPKAAQQLKSWGIETAGDLYHLVNDTPDCGTLEDALTVEVVATESEIDLILDGIEAWAEGEGWKDAFLNNDDVEGYQGFPLHLVGRFQKYLDEHAEPPADASDVVEGLEDVPAGKAEWGISGRHTTALSTPAGAEYVHAKYRAEYKGQNEHLEFRGPVSETGFRSHFFSRPEGWEGPLSEYIDRLARHLARLNGIAAAEAKDAPAWRSIGLNMTGSPIDPKLAKALQKGRLQTLGDLSDAIDLDCLDCTGFKGQTVISQAKFDEARRALEAYQRELDGEPALDGGPDDLGEASYRSEALLAALWPEGGEPDWTKYRRFGSISDREVEAVLRTIWPAKHVYTRDAINDGDGWTTYGGGAPAFWVGDVSGPGLKPIGLHGPELLDAVRRVLNIPAPGGLPRLPGGPAEYPPPPDTVADGPAKKRKRKPATAAVAD